MFWIIFPLGYCIGLFLGGIKPNLFHIIQMFTLSFPACFVMFGINDIYDINSDKLNSRKKDKFYGIVIEESEIKEIKNISLFFSFVIFLASLFSFNLINILLTILALIAVYIYSAPPLRIKGRPILDSIFNMLFLYLPFAMGYSLMGTLNFLNPQLIMFSLTGSAAHAIFAVGDMDSDKKAGIKTFATEYGHVIPLIFAIVLLAINIPFALNIEISAGLLLSTLCFICVLLIFFPKLPIYNWIIFLIILWMMYVITYFSIVFLLKFIFINF